MRFNFRGNREKAETKQQKGINKFVSIVRLVSYEKFEGEMRFEIIQINSILNNSNTFKLAENSKGSFSEDGPADHRLIFFF